MLTCYIRILVPPSSLGGFWIFMYRVSPLTYLLEGLSIAGISNTRVVCSPLEMLSIRLPPSFGTCHEYMAAYMDTAGGYLDNPDDNTTDCQFCPISSADIVLSSLGMGTGNNRAWRNIGFIVIYVVINTVSVFVVYWAARVPKRTKPV